MVESAAGFFFLSFLIIMGCSVARSVIEFGDASGGRVGAARSSALGFDLALAGFGVLPIFVAFTELFAFVLLPFAWSGRSRESGPVTVLAEGGDMGSCATLWALPADSFAVLLARPVPPVPAGLSHDDLREHLQCAAEEVPVEASAIATWSDLGDNDLSRIVRGEAFEGMEAERATEALGRPHIAAQFAGVYLFPGRVLEAAEREALQALGGLLGIEPRTPVALPWWVRARFGDPGEEFWVGLLAPGEVRSLRDCLRVTRLFETLLAWDAARQSDPVRAETYATLTAFLDQAAEAGCWVLGVEGRS